MKQRQRMELDIEVKGTRSSYALRGLVGLESFESMITNSTNKMH